MIYVNDCSIRVVQSCVKFSCKKFSYKLCNLHTKTIFTTKKSKINYSTFYFDPVAIHMKYPYSTATFHSNSYMITSLVKHLA